MTAQGNALGKAPPTPEALKGRNIHFNPIHIAHHIRSRAVSRKRGIPLEKTPSGDAPVALQYTDAPALHWIDSRKRRRIHFANGRMPNFCPRFSTIWTIPFSLLLQFLSTYDSLTTQTRYAHGRQHRLSKWPGFPIGQKCPPGSRTIFPDTPVQDMAFGFSCCI